MSKKSRARLRSQARPSYSFKPVPRHKPRTAKKAKRTPKLKPKAAPQPPTFSDMVDLVYKADKAYQRKKREYEAKLLPMKEALAKMEAEVLQQMLDNKQEAVSTRLATIAIRRTTFAELYDDQAFFEYVGANKAWELVRKQPVVSACRERWDDNVEVPGVRPGVKTELSITSRAKR